MKTQQKKIRLKIKLQAIAHDINQIKRLNNLKKKIKKR